LFVCFFVSSTLVVNKGDRYALPVGLHMGRMYGCQKYTRVYGR